VPDNEWEDITPDDEWEDVGAGDEWEDVSEPSVSINVGAPTIQRSVPDIAREWRDKVEDTVIAAPRAIGRALDGASAKLWEGPEKAENMMAGIRESLTPEEQAQFDAIRSKQPQAIGPLSKLAVAATPTSQEGVEKAKQVTSSIMENVVAAPLGAYLPSAAAKGAATAISVAGSTVGKVANPVARKILEYGVRATGAAVGTAGEGALWGGGSALIRGQNVIEGAKEGAKFTAAAGAAFQLGGDAVRDIASLVKSLKTDPLIRSIDKTVKSQELVKDPSYAVSTKFNDKTFKPSFATAFQDETGQWVGRFAEIPVTGNPRVVDMPLRKLDDFIKFGERVNEKNIGFSPADPGALGRLKPDEYAALQGFKKSAPGTPTKSIEHGSIRVPPQEGIDYGKSIGSDAKTGAQRVRGKLPPPEIEPVSADPVSKPRITAVIEADQIKITEAAPPPPPPPDITDVGDMAPPLPPGKQPSPEELLATVPSAKETATLAQNMARQSPKLMDEWFKNLKADHFYGDETIRQWKLAMNGAKALDNAGENLEAIRRRLPPKKLFDAAANDMTKVGLGKMSWDDFSAKHPQIAEDAVRVVDDQLREIQEGSKEIAALGGIPEDFEILRDAGLKDKYLATVYKSHYAQKGMWAKLAPSEAWENAAKFLQKKHPSWSKGQIIHELQEIVGAANMEERWRTSGLSAAFHSLKAKNPEIPHQLKALMGEEASGPIRIAVSLGRVRTIRAQLKLWKEIAETPGYFSPKGAPPDALERAWIQVPDDPRRFGAAAGGYIPQEMASMLGTANAAHNGLAAANAILSWVKFSQVVAGGFRPWVNNFMRNMWSGVLADGIQPLTNPKEAGRLFATAAKAMWEWKRNPTATSKLKNYVLLSRSTGGLSKGFGRMELAPDSWNMVAELAKHHGHDGLDFIDKLKMKLQQKAINTKDAVASYYDAIDSIWKLGSWIKIYEKNIGAGMSVDAAARAASMRINQSFANFEHLGRWIDQSRKSTLGAGAHYLSGLTEDIRVNAQMLGRLRTEGDLKWRIAANAAAVAGLYEGMRIIRKANGIDDEEVEAAEAIMTKSSRTYRPALMAAPHRDEKGRIQFYDLSTWFTPLQYAYGNIDDPLINRIGTNLFLTPVQGGLAEPLARKIPERLGIVSPLPQFTKEPFTGSNLAERTGGVLDTSGAVPGIIPSAKEALRKTGVTGTLRPNEEQFTPAQGLQKFLGAPFVAPVDASNDSKTRRANLGEFGVEMSKLQDELVRVGLAHRRGEITPEQFARYRNAIAQRMAELARQQRDIQGKLNAVQK